jgi:hypothetical protein
LDLGLGKVLHLSMEEFFRITPFGEIERTPLIGILKDEPFAPSDGFIIRLSFHHALLFSYPPFRHQPPPGLKGAGDRSPVKKRHSTLFVTNLLDTREAKRLKTQRALMLATITPHQEPSPMSS